MPQRRATTKGFSRTSALLQTRIRKAAETRGFAVSRLLTCWAEVVGEDFARLAQPVKVGYGRKGFGATLTVLTNGPSAPLLEMQKERLRERVNTAYGYNAIARVLITQTAPTGFAEAQASFDGPKPRHRAATPDPQARVAAQQAAEPVTDTDLRTALEALGERVLTRARRTTPQEG